MAWICVDGDNGDEVIFDVKPHRIKTYWDTDFDKIYLPKGSIKKLIGINLYWTDEPVELKEDKPYSLDNPNHVE